eukprot:5237988-Amphidinium_carterae.2
MSGIVLATPSHEEPFEAAYLILRLSAAHQRLSAQHWFCEDDARRPGRMTMATQHAGQLQPCVELDMNLIAQLQHPRVDQQLAQLPPHWALQLEHSQQNANLTPFVETVP